jgi:hypothetical protein
MSNKSADIVLVCNQYSKKPILSVLRALSHPSSLPSNLCEVKESVIMGSGVR